MIIAAVEVDLRHQSASSSAGAASVRPLVRPAQNCRTDALASAFGFANLNELLTVMQTCCSWNSAAGKEKAVPESALRFYSARLLRAPPLKEQHLLKCQEVCPVNLLGVATAFFDCASCCACMSVSAAACGWTSGAALGRDQRCDSARAALISRRERTSATSCT